MESIALSKRDGTDVEFSINKMQQAIASATMIPSQNMGGLGLSVSKTRASGASISMGRNTSGVLNWLMTFNKDMKYMVDTDNPIEAVFLEEKERESLRPSNEQLFKRRIEAEIYILEILREKYLYDCDNGMVEYYQDKIDKIEEEHPEWTL